jgi:streptogramin lyase
MRFIVLLAGLVNNPYGLVVGPDNALYICEIGNHRVSRYDLKSKKLTTVVDKQNQPYEIRFDRGGNLYFVDMPDHTVRRLDHKTKALTTLAGTGKPGNEGDGGPAANANLNQPHSIVFHPDGSLLICDIRNSRIRRVDLSTGVISTWGPASLRGPRAIDFAKNGDALLVLREGNTIERIAPNGVMTRVAGTGEKGYSGDGADARHARLNGPKGISVGPDGSIYIADTENHAIRRIDGRSNVITTVAEKLARPHGVFADRRGRVFVADSENHRILLLQ